MDSLSKLTLKGHFGQLKSDINEATAAGKVGIKAKGYETLSDESTHKLLELLIKAVALVEEVYQNDSEFLHEDHVNDYTSMINTLNAHGIAYKGNQDIIDLDVHIPLPLSEKKPMQKAKSVLKNKLDQKRKTG